MGTYTIHSTDSPSGRTLTEQEKHNRDVVLRMNEALYNSGDPERMREFVHPHFITHARDVPGGDLDGVMKGAAEFHRTFPNISIEVTRVLVDGDYVIIMEFGTLAPGMTPNALIEIYRCEDGKIAEQWEVIQDVSDDSVNPLPMIT